MTKFYFDRDIDSEILAGKTMAIIGYGNQGRPQALNMRDSGVKVILGLRENGPSWKLAQKDGFAVFPITRAVEKGDFVHLLLPDEVQPEVYKERIQPHLSTGQTLLFSHGFSVRFNLIQLPHDLDVIMVSPKSVGVMVRQSFLDGSGVPSLIAVHQDYSGQAKNKALGLAKAIGSGRVGIIETTFQDETDTDLFSEQVDICGGATELIQKSFEVLVEAGYSREAAYFECLNELKLIIDIVQKRGLEGMWSKISNTAEYGGRTRGKRIINEKTKEEMRAILAEIRSGAFAREWLAEYRQGLPNLKKMRSNDSHLEIEMVGKELRKLLIPKKEK